MRNVTSGCDNGAPFLPWIMTMFQAERERMPVREEEEEVEEGRWPSYDIRSCNCYAPDIGRGRVEKRERYPKKDSVKEELSFALEGGGGDFFPEPQVSDMYIYIYIYSRGFFDFSIQSRARVSKNIGASFFVGRNRDARHGQCCNLT